MTRRRRFNPRNAHVRQIDGTLYFCKGIPESKTFYLIGIINYLNV
nr:MAG TPA: hypothetical protein [Crassvirales sp.]